MSDSAASTEGQALHDIGHESRATNVNYRQWTIERENQYLRERGH